MIVKKLPFKSSMSTDYGKKKTLLKYTYTIIIIIIIIIIQKINTTKSAFAT